MEMLMGGFIMLLGVACGSVLTIKIKGTPGPQGPPGPMGPKGDRGGN